MRTAVAVLAVAILTGGTWTATAVAQEDGVYLDDPDSPGGKEYAIPHERSRREAAGSPGGGGGAGGGNGGSEDEAPRFGAGIQPEAGGPSSGGAAGSEGGSGPGSSGADSGGDVRGGSGDSPPGEADGGDVAGGSSSAPNGADYRATSSSDQPELTLSALALGVIIAGGGLGLLLRRSRRDAAD
jgi:hypothetical protein